MRIPRLRGPQVLLDVIIDGTPLSRRLQELEVSEPEDEGFREPFDRTSIVDPAWPRRAAEDLQRLVGDLPSDESDWPLEPGRLPLYVCPECADLACGAVTVHVVHDEITTTWQDFRYEDGYSDHETLQDLSALGPFTFLRGIYREALLGPVAGLLALEAEDRAAEREHRRQRTPAGLWRRLRGR